MNIRIGYAYVSVLHSNGHVLLALHKRWRFDKVDVAMKPGYTRWYIGPIEIERYKR